MQPPKPGSEIPFDASSDLCVDALEKLLAAAEDQLLLWDAGGRLLAASPSAAAALERSPEQLEGRSCAELGLPAQLEALRRQVLETRAAVRAPASPPDETSYALTPVFGNDGLIAAVLARVSPPRRSPPSPLAAIGLLTDPALAGLPSEALAHELAARVRRIFGSDIASVILPAEDGAGLVVRACDGFERAVEERFCIPLGQGISGKVFSTGEPLLVPDLSRVEVASASLRERIRSLVSVPLMAGDRSLGVLDVGSSELSRFTAADVRLLEALAGPIAAALECARLLEHERRRRVEVERDRDALELQLSTVASLVVVLDFEGNIFRFNAACEQVTGYSFAEVVGRNAFELFLPPEQHGVVERFVEELVQSPGRGRIESEWMTRDGRRRLIAWQTELLFNPDGEPELVLATGIDVTDARRAEQALRRSEEHFRQLAETMPQLVWFTGPDGGVEYLNDRWREYTGAKVEFLMGDLWSRFLHPEDAARTAETWSRCIAGGQPYEVEGRLRRFDGEYRWFLARAAPIHDESGRVFRWFGTWTEIHQLKEAEEKQREANDRFAEADRRKTEFMAMLSHELRNPLAPIRNSVYILGRSPAVADEHARAALEVIDRQAQHMSNLIDDLLDVTRISRGKIRLRCEPLDLDALARTAAEDHRSEFAEAGVELSVGTAASPLFVNGDPTRLSQIIGNLLQNAAKFTPRGGRATLTIERRGEQVEVRVRDTGAGLSEEMRQQLFEPFAQADKTLDRSKGGLGLGLSLVRGLVELHGGTVTAHSDGPGRGAQFTVSVPLMKGVVAQPSAPAVAAAPAAASRRVLVIEDNVDAAETMKVALEIFEHVVEIAHSGPEGLKKARRFNPDVILCDIGLPGMDGYEVARAMREDPQLRKVYLVAVTGYTLKEDLERAIDAGFDKHLPKPTNLDTLERLLATAPLRQS